MAEDASPERALEARPLVKATAAIQAVCGLYVGLSAVQLLTSLTFYGELLLVQYLNWALLALGASQVALAAGTLRLRGIQAIAAAVLAGILAPVVSAWAALNLSLAIFSCMQAGAVLLAWSAALLSPFAIPPARAADAARRKLAAEGMDLGM